MVNELAHFAATLTDQAHHSNFRFGKAGHHAQQNGFAHATAGKEPQTLTASHGKQAIDRPHAHIQRLLNRVAVQRVNGFPVQGHHVVRLERSLTIQWPSYAVDHPPQQTKAHRHQAGADSGTHRRTGCQTIDTVQRHQIDTVTGESHHFGFDAALILQRHQTVVAQRHLEPHRFQGQADQARDPPLHFRARRLIFKLKVTLKTLIKIRHGQHSRHTFSGCPHLRSESVAPATDRPPDGSAAPPDSRHDSCHCQPGSCRAQDCHRPVH